jgi:DNA-directed RNA polymerase
MMFTLNRVISRDTNTHPDDTSIIKSALTALGYYDDSETGLSPYPDDQLFKSINSFQKDNELKVDGVIKPDGPTQAKIKEKVSENKSAENALNIFMRNRQDMMDANTIGADKYFHCVANYEATRSGWNGEKNAESLSNAREILFMPKEIIKHGFKDALKDSVHDQLANMYGRTAAKSGNFPSAQEACAIYRPKGLDDKY